MGEQWMGMIGIIARLKSQISTCIPNLLHVLTHVVQKATPLTLCCEICGVSLLVALGVQNGSPKVGVVVVRRIVTQCRYGWGQLLAEESVGILTSSTVVGNEGQGPQMKKHHIFCTVVMHRCQSTMYPPSWGISIPMVFQAHRRANTRCALLQDGAVATIHALRTHLSSVFSCKGLRAFLFS